MASRKFELEIDLKSKGAEKDLKKFNKTLDDTNKKTKESGKSSKSAKSGLAGFAGGLKSAAGAAATFGAGILAAGAAVNTAILSLADQTRELENFARTAQLSIGQYQALALTAERYGISGEKASEMVQDFNDKLGDFVTTGAGPFEDALIALGDKSEGFIEKLQTMSGPDGLIYAQNQLQAAGVSGKQLTFVMEGLASDSSKLTKAFNDNGKELKDVNKQMDALGSKLSNADLQQLKIYKQEWELFNTTLLKFGVVAANTVLPYINKITEFIAVFNKGSHSGMLEAQLAPLSTIQQMEELGNMSLQAANRISKLREEYEATSGFSKLGKWVIGPVPESLGLSTDAMDLKKQIDEQMEWNDVIQNRINITTDLLKIENDVATQTVNTKPNEKEAKKLDYVKKTTDQLRLQLELAQKEQAGLQISVANHDAIVVANQQQLTIDQLKSTLKDKEVKDTSVILKLQQDLLKTQEETSRLLGFKNKEKALRRELQLLKANTEEQKEQLRLSHEMDDLKLNETERTTLEGIQAQIDARQKHLDMLEKEKEAVQNLAEAMGRWASGSKDAVKQVIAELIRLVAIRAFGGTGSFGGGFLTGFGSGGMNGYAEGGNFNAGETFMVGERGPEIITASAPGAVIPNHKLGGAGISITPQLVINGGVNGVDELSSMFSDFSNEIASQTQHLIKTQLGPRGVFA